MVDFVTGISAGVTWEQALALATKAGGVLLTDKTPIEDYWLKQLADQTDDIFYEYAQWTSAHHTSAGWVWGDGSAVDKAKFGEGDVNGDDDPSNDSAYVALENSSLRAVVNPVYSFLVFDAVTGTEFSDHFLGSAPTKMLGGDDSFSGYGSGTIDGGAGDDAIVLLENDPSVSVIDGLGRDYVEIQTGGVIKATLDGANDELWAETGRVTYGAATTDITVDAIFGVGYGIVRGVQTGTDDVRANEFVAGSGNDHLAGFNRIQGGAGNDYIEARYFAEGGAGNDTLVARSDQRVDMRGGDGADTLIFYSGGSVSGGAGADTFVFQEAAQVTINDLQVGDHIDLSALLPGTIGEAFGDDFLRVTFSKGYTYVEYDSDGGADHFMPLIGLKGYFPDVADYLIG